MINHDLMREMLILMASKTSEAQLAEQLQSALFAYNAHKTEINRQHLQVMCMVYASKEAIDRQGHDKFAREVEEVDRIRQRINPTS